MKKVLPWPILFAVLLAAIPIASQFTPIEVARKLGTWRTIALVVFSVLLAVSLIRLAIAYFSKANAVAPEGKVSQHDIQLFVRINDVLNDGALTFLADHDFRNNLHVSKLQPITTISYWHGPSYIFNDDVIQARWKMLFEKILHLGHTHGSNLTNSEDNVEIMTAWHMGSRRHPQPPQVVAEIKKLNDAAADVYNEFSSFAPFARKRLGL